MRPASLADALFGKVKQAAIGVLFSKPDRPLHVREIARLGGVSAPAMHKELKALSAVGILTAARRGNQLLFQANAACPLFEELHGIAVKTSGVADQVRQALANVNGMESAFIFGSLARGEDRSDSDVDVFVLGSCSYHDVLDALQPMERRIGRPINPIVYSPTELKERLAENNAFAQRILADKRIHLIGDKRGLEAFQSPQAA